MYRFSVITCRTRIGTKRKHSRQFLHATKTYRFWRMRRISAVDTCYLETLGYQGDLNINMYAAKIAIDMLKEKRDRATQKQILLLSKLRVMFNRHKLTKRALWSRQRLSGVTMLIWLSNTMLSHSCVSYPYLLRGVLIVFAQDRPVFDPSDFIIMPCGSLWNHYYFHYHYYSVQLQDAIFN